MFLRRAFYQRFPHPFPTMPSLTTCTRCFVAKPLDAFHSGQKFFATCNECRAKRRNYHQKQTSRKPLGKLDPNVRPLKRSRINGPIDPDTLPPKTAAQMEEARNLTSSQRVRQNNRDEISRNSRAQARDILRGDCPRPDLPPLLQPLPSSFHCYRCNIERAIARFPILPEWVCEYCHRDIDPTPDQEWIWCQRGRHDVLMAECVHNGFRYSSCRRHYHHEPVSAPPPPPPPLPPSVPSIDPSTSALPPLRQRIERHDLDLPAVPDDHWAYIASFHKELRRRPREICDICNEIGLDMKLEEERPGSDVRICHRCRLGRKKGGHQIDIFSAANNMDPGPIPSHLPHLSMAGEMLIARAHVTMNLWRYKGQQYQYSGHVVSYLQNVPKVVSILPSLPSELQVLRLTPAASAANQTVQKEFERHCRVKRSDIEIWLRYLIQHHPDYRDVQIDGPRLSALPEDGSIMDDLPSSQLTATDDAIQGENQEEDTAAQPNQEDQGNAVGPSNDNGKFSIRFTLNPVRQLGVTCNGRFCCKNRGFGPGNISNPYFDFLFCFATPRPLCIHSPSSTTH